MKSFRKSSSRKDENQSKAPTSVMKWFKKSTVEKDGEQQQSQLRQEIDVVPRTEFTASRQALSNISIALNVDESSGESSGKNRNDNDKMSCENKYCCGNFQGNEPADKSIDGIIKDYKNSKASLIDNLRAADSAHASKGSVVNEPKRRRSRKNPNNVKNGGYIAYFDLYIDYGRLECPDSPYHIFIDQPKPQYVQLKTKKQRQYSNTYDLFTTSDKLESADGKSTLNYKLLSAVEGRLDETKYNLQQCQLFNNDYQKSHEKLGSGCIADWTLQDFNDDNKSTRMNDDTRTIKEFYKLNNDGHVLLHFQDIAIETGRNVETKGFKHFLAWIVLKGQEITEQQKSNKTSWIKTILKRLAKSKHPRNKAEKSDPGDGVEAYTLALAQDESSVFAKNIYNFIACTRESREKIPHKVMRNIRQFMNGMKNYLVKHGEKDFGNEVDKARAALKPDEFLNLDQILEGVMHQLVILPLREHLYELFVEFYSSSGDIKLIISNMKFAENKDPEAFGVKKGLKTPSPQALNRISMLFAKLQEAELPFEKLDFLLTAMTMILDNTVDPDSDTNDVRHFGCDDFLPLLAYVLCKCGFHFAEIEAEYIWGLMMPTVMNGQAGYYTTVLCSAAVSLKEFKQQFENPEGALVPNNSLECSVLRIIIPNEYNGSIQTKAIPVRPHTTTRDVCRIIAHKSQITNPMDYGLFKLIDGEETLLMDNDCPQDIRLASAGKHCSLVFRRFDSKIAWPKQ